ncbi:SpoIIIAH-like family protein [Bacillus sp. DX1.1]|uniref:SpoIIIAH-like family protein n=1 Tax=unclassified Bacillus (in: firmicutes) TaxID=185979 RepID=UPI002570CAE9|nr:MULTISPECIES: SpoIIIAH-like family protein [unclassified Bacillus (in: firmicutes)]MDM5156387.1 SpoIIIAH-like family protein [Bacillus sp. DX1.1]WJE80659.1 SpoIIIAH-like family protein [Bacillus sp. DX3.1]
MLKKQTVWLLTMLSLVVVLSVYYVTAPEKLNQVTPTASDKLGQEKQGVEKEVTKETTTETPNKETDKKENGKKETSKKESNVTVQSSDDNFTAMRLKMDDQRSEAKEKLQEVMNSTKSSAEQISKAKEEFNALNDVAAKETLLETVIKSQGGYKDALVRADGSDIKVTVKAAKHSQKEANKIIQLVRSEEGLKDVGVKFDVAK